MIEEAGEESGRVVKVFIAMSENREAAIVETLGENLEVDVHPHLEGLNNDDELGGMRDYRVEPRDQTPFRDVAEDDVIFLHRCRALGGKFWGFCKRFRFWF